MYRDILKTIVAVRNTLDTIPVAGAQSVSRMTGCFQALDELIQELGQKPEQADGDKK